jgi:hypothetical protein
VLSLEEARYVRPYYLKIMGLNAIGDERNPPVQEVERA